MSSSYDYEKKALHFSNIGFYDAAQVFATLALMAAMKESTTHA